MESLVTTGLYLLLGAAFAFAFIHAAVRRSIDAPRKLGTALLVASFIYVAFAMAAMETKWLLIEISGVAAFACFLVLSRRRSLRWLAAGWCLHVLWDVALHSGAETAFVPEWYPILCVSFDLVIAAYILRSNRDEERLRTAVPAQ